MVTPKVYASSPAMANPRLKKTKTKTEPGVGGAQPRRGRGSNAAGGGAQTPVGARRLTKAMLLRHIFLKKAGHAGFMTKCSSSIRSSVNRVRQ